VIEDPGSPAGEHSSQLTAYDRILEVGGSAVLGYGGFIGLTS
jgi:hypothetical protein